MRFSTLACVSVMIICGLCPVLVESNSTTLPPEDLNIREEDHSSTQGTIRTSDVTPDDCTKTLQCLTNETQMSTTPNILHDSDLGFPYINATVIGSPEVTSDERKTVMWTIVIDAYPGNVTLAWFKPDGNRIVTDSLDKHYKYSHTTEGMRHFFHVSQLNVEDTGNYTVEFSTGKNNTIVQLQLKVHAKPSVRIDKVMTLYQKGESASFTCNVLGLPSPNITWIIAKYPDFSSKDNPVLTHPSNLTIKPGEKGPYHLVSTVNVITNETVGVTCKSCNAIACDHSTKQVLVSGTFGIIGPDGSEVTVGDNINLTCEADGYTYNGSIEWSRQDSKEQSFTSTQSKSKSSWQSTLNIHNVQKSAAGSYICKAVTKEGRFAEKNYHLVVHDGFVPWIHPPAMNNATTPIALESQPHQSLTLKCSGEGKPIPKITWYKDDELISSNNQYNFSNNNSTLEITYFLSGDSGTYSCKVENCYGTATSYTDIVIAGDSSSITLWIGVICVLVVILVVVTTFSIITLSRAKKSRKKLLDARGLAHFENGVVGFPNLDSTDRSEVADYFMMNNAEPERTVEFQMRQEAVQSTEL